VEGTDHYCGSLRLSCCLSDTGLFKNLNHYWEGINSSESYSKDLSTWSKMVYQITSVFDEIWQTRAKVVLKSSITESFKKKINALLDNKIRFTTEKIDVAKKCFKNIKTMMHGAMCSMCSPETF
jgi:hypothetical protein